MNSDHQTAIVTGAGSDIDRAAAQAWAQTGAHEKPVGLLNVRNYYAPLLTALDHAVNEGFIFTEHRNALLCDPDPVRLLDAMMRYEHPHEAVKRWMREE